MWAKITTIKRTKDLNYFSLCALNLFIHEFHNLSWITEINELFHDIIIYWEPPASVLRRHIYVAKCKSILTNQKMHEVTRFAQYDQNISTVPLLDIQKMCILLVIM